VFVCSQSGSDIRLIKMACEQLAYTAVKFSNANDDRITAHQLANIKGRIDTVGTSRHSELISCPVRSPALSFSLQRRR
jgi:hypothetical protein